MRGIRTKPFDAAKYIDTPEAQADLVADALETGHAGYIAAALGVVARARGMTQLAADTGSAGTRSMQRTARMETRRSTPC